MHRSQHIADLGPLFIKHEVRNVVICPGSRNAPLIQLFTSGEQFRCHSVVDERSAAYIALGMARQLHEPVAVVTTSGTAVMNLAPAVAEAHYQHLPLILITGDRPLEPVPQFNNQLIDQTAPFQRNSKGFYGLPMEINSRDALEEVLEEVAKLIGKALSWPAGPVHLNVPLSEPLYERLPDPVTGLDEPEPGLKEEALASGEAFLPQGAGQDLIQADDVSGQTEEPLQTDSWHGKTLVLAGMGDPDPGTESILRAASVSGSVAVVAENLANMPSADFIANPELVLAGAYEEERQSLFPDRLICFGGQVVSKQMRLFLQSLKDNCIRVLGPEPGAELKRIWGDFSRASSGVKSDLPGRYSERWKRIERRELESAGYFLAEAPFCNLTALQRIISAIPSGSALHLGNSASVRYSQLYPLRRDLVYYSNRGTSGIDGCLSTAVGAAMVSNLMNVVVLGDLSFVYDSNALWNSDFPENLKIVVLNDGGGGIFRMLEGPSEMDFYEKFSVTHHPVSIELLSQSFGRGWISASTMRQVEEGAAALFRGEPGVSVLEVDTTGSENSRIFKAFINRNN